MVRLGSEQPTSLLEFPESDRTLHFMNVYGQLLNEFLEQSSEPRRGGGVNNSQRDREELERAIVLNEELTRETRRTRNPRVTHLATTEKRSASQLKLQRAATELQTFQFESQEASKQLNRTTFLLRAAAEKRASDVYDLLGPDGAAADSPEDPRWNEYIALLWQSAESMSLSLQRYKESQVLLEKMRAEYAEMARSNIVTEAAAELREKRTFETGVSVPASKLPISRDEVCVICYCEEPDGLFFRDTTAPSDGGDDNGGCRCHLKSFLHFECMLALFLDKKDYVFRENARCPICRSSLQFSKDIWVLEATAAAAAAAPPQPEATTESSRKRKRSGDDGDDDDDDDGDEHARSQKRKL